jgi:hypothetical protein
MGIACHNGKPCTAVRLLCRRWGVRISAGAQAILTGLSWVPSLFWDVTFQHELPVPYWTPAIWLPISRTYRVTVCYRCTEAIYRYHHLGLKRGQQRFKMTYRSHSQGLISAVRSCETLADPTLQGWHLVTGLSRQPVGRISKGWLLKMRPRGCPKTSITNYHPMLRYIPEQQRPQLHSGKSLISRRLLVAFSVRFGHARLAFHVVRTNSA